MFVNLTKTNALQVIVVAGNYLFEDINLSLATLFSIVLVSVSLYLYNKPTPKPTPDPEALK